MLSVKQRGVKYHFLSLWYDLTWDWTPISQTIGKHSTLDYTIKCPSSQSAGAGKYADSISAVG